MMDGTNGDGVYPAGMMRMANNDGVWSEKSAEQRGTDNG